MLCLHNGIGLNCADWLGTVDAAMINAPNWCLVVLQEKVRSV